MKTTWKGPSRPGVAMAVVMRAMDTLSCPEGDRPIAGSLALAAQRNQWEA
jgi:hypothetical protein